MGHKMSHRLATTKISGLIKLPVKLPPCLVPRPRPHTGFDAQFLGTEKACVENHTYGNVHDFTCLSMVEFAVAADSVIFHLPKVILHHGMHPQVYSAFQFLPMLGLLASPYAGFTPKLLK